MLVVQLYCVGTPFEPKKNLRIILNQTILGSSNFIRKGNDIYDIQQIYYIS
jgi:hypothetical protein